MPHELNVQDISKLSPDTPIGEISFVAFDTETTGFSPVACRIVELSAVKFKLGEKAVKTFSTLIDPQLSIPPEVSNIHGITDQMVAGQPKFHQAAINFAQWLGEDSQVLVAHNAPFDVDFMRASMERSKLDQLPHPVIDTLYLARRFTKGAQNHKLKTLVEHFGLPSGGYHRALEDSMHVAHLFNRMSVDWPDIKTWGDLSKVSGLIWFVDKRANGPVQTAEESALVEFIKRALNEGKRKYLLAHKTEKSEPKVVTPLSLVRKDGIYYLDALCHNGDGELTFRLDGIASLTAAD